MRTKTEIRKELTSISTEIAQLQKALAALQKELKNAPTEFEVTPGGLFWCQIEGDPRFILKLGEDSTAYLPDGGLAANTPGFIVDRIRDGEYVDLRLLKAIELFAPPMEKIDVDWELIDRPRNTAEYFAEMQKLAAWARPLLEGK